MLKRSNPDQPELSRPSTKRAKQIDSHPPYVELRKLLAEQKEVEVTNVLHWFRSNDLRIEDNKALHAASQFAQASGKPLFCVFLDCPAEYEWHGTSPARLDFNCQTLTLMQQKLRMLDIPLVFLTASARNDIVPTILQCIRDNHVSHVYANYEYEIDELRRDIRLLKQANDGEVHFSLYHDQTVVEPGTVLTAAGGPMRVFTPYHKAWLVVLKREPSLLDLVPPPSRNSLVAKAALQTLFDSTPPKVPPSKPFSSIADRDRIRELWPAGHDAGLQRMRAFLSQIDKYAATRSNPAKDSTSRMSVYFSTGAVSVREAMLEVKKHNRNSTDFGEAGSKPGVYGWVREIVFRELYRQTTMTTPHVAMNLPNNLKFEFVQWEDDEEGWIKWKAGRTGVPFIDAGMRQLNTEAWMHNRLRMNVSSYLSCNLLLDYRRGERYFAETLIDWDLNNNTQGWEPSYPTVFNPTSQAEKNDPDGEYIRRWVPELRGVKGKAVFSPHDRLSKAEFEKLGYPRPHVDWKETKVRCMERYKRDMTGAVP